MTCLLNSMVSTLMWQETFKRFAWLDYSLELMKPRESNTPVLDSQMWIKKLLTLLFKQTFLVNESDKFWEMSRNQSISHNTRTILEPKRDYSGKSRRVHRIYYKDLCFFPNVMQCECISLVIIFIRIENIM